MTVDLIGDPFQVPQCGGVLLLGFRHRNLQGLDPGLLSLQSVVDAGFLFEVWPGYKDYNKNLYNVSDFACVVPG